MSENPAPAVPLIRDGEIFIRMTAGERVRHLITTVAFTALIVTGLPLMLPRPGLSRLLFGSARAFPVRGVIHRVAAVLLIANLVWTLLDGALTARGRQYFRDMRPRVRDLRDAVQSLGHNLGLSAFLIRHGLLTKFFARHPFWRFDDPPELGRFGFVEKFEHWPFLWGSTLMILTGLFMWNLNLSLRLFPLWLHNVFIVMHGYEAILALISVFVWHMYTAHFDRRVFPMSRIWIDGKITGRELRERHPLEYARIAAERAASLSAPAAVPSAGPAGKNEEDPAPDMDSPSPENKEDPGTNS